MNTSANRYFAVRPDDTTYPTLQSLVDVARHEREHSKEARYNLKDLRMMAVDAFGNELNGNRSHELATTDTIKLVSPRGPASMTHWSFGQLCRTLGAPAAYLRNLPPYVSAQALNHGLTASNPGSTANILVQRANGNPEPIVRACTSETYGRLWDSDLFQEVQSLLCSRGWGVESAYRSDRNSIVTLTNKRVALIDPSVQNIVNDPNADAGGIMYRSIRIGNSETGAGSVWWDAGYFRARCKNLAIWSFMLDSRFRRRHVGKEVLADVVRKIAELARVWSNASTETDQRIVQSLISREVAHTKEAVIDELKALGATKDQATAAYELCEKHEVVSPRSFWGAVQGLTRLSQDSAFQDERVELDRLAGQILAKGAKLVAA